MANKVVVAMSGGIDSSVVAYLLKEKGYDIVGATMKLIDTEESNQSIEDAKEICNSLGIKHYVFDLQKEFKEQIINYFINSYKEGKTPNPCVMCNKYFKFGLFYEKSKKELNADYIATGHYAKIIDNKLHISNESNKDQTYFLYGINKEVLKHILFPLSEYNNKEEIRLIAEKANLKTKTKKDSQEVCFVPNDDYKEFLKVNKVISKEGNIVLKDGTILGKHTGITNYTIGQRKGLNISYKEPLYVIELDIKNNQIIVGSNNDLYNNTIYISDLNLLVDNLPEEIYIKVRSRGKLYKANIEILNNNNAKVILEDKERAITPGQSLVIYNQNNYCLGGGIIEKYEDTN